MASRNVCGRRGANWLPRAAPESNRRKPVRTRFGRANEIHDLHLSAHLLELMATMHGKSGDLQSATQLLSIVTGVYDLSLIHI